MKILLDNMIHNLRHQFLLKGKGRCYIISIKLYKILKHNNSLKIFGVTLVIGLNEFSQCSNHRNMRLRL